MTNDRFRDLYKALAVADFAVLETEGLLAQIPEEVEALNADVGALDRALEEATEVLQPVGVDFLSWRDSI